MPRIRTPRLVLVPATVETLNAELEGNAAFARAVGAEVSDEWPPELYDEAATRWTLAALRHRSHPHRARPVDRRASLGGIHLHRTRR